MVIFISILTGVLLMITASTIATSGHTPIFFLKEMRRVNKKEKLDSGSQWETHPCTLPEVGTGHQITAQNSIWACWCGRRWKFIRIKVADNAYVQFSYQWVEWTVQMELEAAEKIGIRDATS